MLASRCSTVPSPPTLSDPTEPASVPSFKKCKKAEKGSYLHIASRGLFLGAPPVLSVYAVAIV